MSLNEGETCLWDIVLIFSVRGLCLSTFIPKPLGSPLGGKNRFGQAVHAPHYVGADVGATRGPRVEAKVRATER